MSDTPTPVIDGVDVGKLLATVADIKTRPSPADFTFRAGMDVTRARPNKRRVSWVPVARMPVAAFRVSLLH